MFNPNMFNQFNEFRRTFNGNPQEEVQRLIQEGRMSQEDFERLSKMATELQSMFGNLAR